MLKCKICGKEFEANLERHYVSRDIGKSGLAVLVANDEEKLYDTFDCPACGCQLVVQERKREYVVPNAVAANEEEECSYEEQDKPICYGNFEEENSEDCDRCKLAEDCVREEYRKKILEKCNKRPKCFGNLDEEEAGDCEDCEYAKDCIIESHVESVINKRKRGK